MKILVIAFLALINQSWSKLTFGPCKELEPTTAIDATNYETVYSERWQHLMRDKQENWQWPRCQYHDWIRSSDEIKIKIRGATESPLFTGFWNHLFFYLAPWNSLPSTIYRIFYNTASWDFDSTKPAIFEGRYPSSKYTILEYSPTGYIAAYVCQPILFGLMHFQDFILMTSQYSDWPESLLSGPDFEAFKTTIKPKLEPAGYRFPEDTEEVVANCCWSSCY